MQLDDIVSFIEKGGKPQP
jgi:hypothetical protein